MVWIQNRCQKQTKQTVFELTELDGEFLHIYIFLTLQSNNPQPNEGAVNGF
jgi:hypothetical protein